MSSLPVERTVHLALPAAARCAHLRQRHPRQSGSMLPCAWPACPGGVPEATLSISRVIDTSIPSPPLEKPLLVERRLLVLEEGERVFIWHPSQR
jgi:hypothetical protein